MADYTASSGNWMRPYRTPWGGFHTKHFPENQGSSFLAGQLVMQSTIASTSSHRIEEMTSLSTLIVGVAAESAIGTVDTMHPVWEANPNVEFQGLAKGTLASSNIGASYSFAYDSSKAIYYVDLTNSSAADQRCIVTGIVSPSAVGDTNGIVSFRFRTEDGLATSTGRGYVLAYYR